MSQKVLCALPQLSGSQGMLLRKLSWKERLQTQSVPMSVMWVYKYIYTYVFRCIEAKGQHQMWLVPQEPPALFLKLELLIWNWGPWVCLNLSIKFQESSCLCIASKHWDYKHVSPYLYIFCRCRDPSRTFCLCGKHFTMWDTSRVLEGWILMKKNSSWHFLMFLELSNLDFH